MNQLAPVVRVGKYILKNKIGEGAFTEVRYAMHEDTGKEYAVKVFDRANLLKKDFRLDIKKEIKILQRLRHPNIVSIHTALVTDSRLYLVMEFVCGGQLYEEILKCRRIDEDSSRRYFQQLTDAIVYCHRRGVFHRDLKPENLLLDKKGNLKVTAFGMSWISEKADLESKTQHLLRTQCGTPNYMAPEIIDRPSQGYDGAKLDAWDCGMVLFVLLAGYMPFSGEDDGALFQSILKGNVKFPPFFSAGARSILLSLLQKDPDKRASLEEVRQHPWFQINYFGEPAVPLSSKYYPEKDSPSCGSSGPRKHSRSKTNSFSKSQPSPRNHAKTQDCSPSRVFPDRFKRAQANQPTSLIIDADSSESFDEIECAPLARRKNAMLS